MAPTGIRGTIRVREGGIVGQLGPVLEVPDVKENAAVVAALRQLHIALNPR
jgi:hypothetical protein